MSCNSNYGVYVAILAIATFHCIHAKPFDTMDFTSKLISHKTSNAPQYTLDLPGDVFTRYGYGNSDAEKTMTLPKETPTKQNATSVSICKTLQE